MSTLFWVLMSACLWFRLCLNFRIKFACLDVNLGAFNSRCFGHQNKKPLKDFKTFFRMAGHPIQKMKGHLIIDISILLPKIIGVDLKSAKQSDNNGNVNVGEGDVAQKHQSNFARSPFQILMTIANAPTLNDAQSAIGSGQFSLHFISPVHDSIKTKPHLSLRNRVPSLHSM